MKREDVLNHYSNLNNTVDNISIRFIGVGAMRSGTTSLFYQLTKHPDFASPRYKETRFFDWYFNKGYEFYRNHFIRSLKEDQFIGEFTPGYFTHPFVPERIKSLFDYKKTRPKFILLLRNPVERAVSHWAMLKQFSLEPLNFIDAMEAEKDRLNFPHMKCKDEFHHNYGYRFNGIYAMHLSRWLKYFDLKDFIIIQSEDLFQNPNEQLKLLYDFLGVRYDSSHKFIKCNSYTNQFVGDFGKKEISYIKDMRKEFTKHNNNLSDILGRSFSWQ